MKYDAIVNFIQSQPMYSDFVGRKSIPATNAQLEKLVKSGVLEAKIFSVIYYNETYPHLETQYRKK